jgi:DinB superfamily
MPAATTAAPVTAKTAKQFAIESMTFAHAYAQKLINEVPESKAFFQSCPTDNHVLWTVGHFACTNAWLATLLDANAKVGVPENYNALFGMESKPSPDPKAYPPLAQVKKHWEDSFAALVKLFEATPDSQMSAETASNGYGFCTSKCDVALKSAWHEGYHLGQIASLRKAMGIVKPK